MSVTRTDPPPDSQPAQQEGGQAIPYPPSFIDWFAGFIQCLAIPYGHTYLLLFILESAVLHLLSWIDGWLPAYRIDLLLLAFPIWLWGPLAIVTYLDSLSLRALSEFGPLLDIPTVTKRPLEYEFTTMPVRGVLLSAIAWSGVHLLFWFVVFAPASPSMA